MIDKNIKLFISFSIILFITIGFAVISTNLSINGTFNFTQNEWNIYFKNIQLDSGSVSTVNPTISNDKLSVNFSVSLKEPDEYYLFYVDAVNESTLNAMINEVKIEGLDEVTDYLECNVTYQDGTSIGKNDILYKGFSNTYRIELKYKDINVNQIPSNNLSPEITVSINYRQANKNAVLKQNTNFVYFDYKGSEDTYNVPMNATYKLEVWGAQGGYGYTEELFPGGVGGYSVGNISLNKNQILYINVGGQGQSGCLKVNCNGGYNGGGISGKYTLDSQNWNGGGGGATHIATYTGLLASLNEKIDNILIVAGGGGGSIYRTSIVDGTYGGSGGGYIGNYALRMGTESYGTGGTQQASGKNYTSSSTSTTSGFGYGADTSRYNAPGGGAGFYGGGIGAGGSGYIGNNNLTNKIMYCYNCQESTEEEDETHIKTRSTTNASLIAIANYAKKGNGCARISLININ